MVGKSSIGRFAAYESALRRDLVAKDQVIAKQAAQIAALKAALVEAVRKQTTREERAARAAKSGKEKCLT